MGTAIATRLGVGFLPLRKGGRLPYPDMAIATGTYRDYSGTQKSLFIQKGLLPPGSRILLADEWIETGAVTGLATIGIDPTQRAGPRVD